MTCKDNCLSLTLNSVKTMQHDATPSLVPHITSCPIPSWPQPVELVLWDSPGPVDENLIPKLVETIAEQIHCVVLCFAVDEPDLISDVDTMVSASPRTPEMRAFYSGYRYWD